MLTTKISNRMEKTYNIGIWCRRQLKHVKQEERETRLNAFMNDEMQFNLIIAWQISLTYFVEDQALNFNVNHYDRDG